MKYTKLFLALALMLTLVTLASCSFVSSLLPQPKSAYEIAVENGFQGSEADWLASIKGDRGNDGNDGNDGNNGKSAYELYCELFGYEGTEEQWLIDLRTGALIFFNVTFDLGGGEAPEGFVSSTTVRGGSFLDLKTPTRDGYTFVGWWTGDGNTDFAMSETIAVRSDLTLTAKWRKDVMSVRFLDKDGKLLKQETVPYGVSATAPQAPEVAAFMFQKWDVDFSVVTEDLIVKAVYSPLYTLSFNTDGGTEIADTTYISGDVPATPADPQKGDLVFRGWYADEGFTIPYDFSAPLTQNTTIYAYFSDMKPITNAEELKAIGDHSTGKFYLTNDINLGGDVWTPLVGFAGEFDGRGYKIHNFIISETQSAGFFTTNSGTIQNLTLADFAFTVSAVSTNVAFNAGALVGTNDGNIENCHIVAAILTYHSYKSGGSGYSDSYAGGLVGVNNGTVSDSSVDVKIAYCAEAHISWSGSVAGGPVLWLGGVVGKNSGIIAQVVANTVIEGNTTGSRGDYDYANSTIKVGGLVSLNDGEVSLCESNVSVTTTTGTSTDMIRSYLCFGGFVYQNIGTITQCSATGLLDATSATVWNFQAGGFVVLNETQIADCYTSVMMKTPLTLTHTATEIQSGGFVAINKGIVTTSYTSSVIEAQSNGYFGGFVGSNESGGVIKNCFATGSISNQNTPTRVAVFVASANNGGALSKNYYSTESKITQGETDVTVADENATAADLATLQSKAFLVDTLGWNTEVWEIVDGQYPTLIASE